MRWVREFVCILLIRKLFTSAFYLSIYVISCRPGVIKKASPPCSAYLNSVYHTIFYSLMLNIPLFLASPALYCVLILVPHIVNITYRPLFDIHTRMFYMTFYSIIYKAGICIIYYTYGNECISTVLVYLVLANIVQFRPSQFLVPKYKWRVCDCELAYVWSSVTSQRECNFIYKIVEPFQLQSLFTCQHRFIFNFSFVQLKAHA